MPEIEVERWAHPALILVATNLDDVNRLMPFALQMATDAGAALLLLHVLPVSASLTVDAVGMPYYDPVGALECAAKALNPWCEFAHARGMKCEALVRSGQAPQEILSAVRQFGADRILLGTRSRSKLGKLFLGSVAEQVLRSVRIPVITVGPEAHLPVESSDWQKTVLHATTLGETSRPNAALACQIAASQRARLILLHVLPPIGEMQCNSLPSELDSAVLHELRSLAAETGAACCSDVEEKVLRGHPAIEILAEAAASHAGLIVLGAARRSPFENLARDRIAYRVLAHARCPVLTLCEPTDKPARNAPQGLAMHR
jgi:nucleotide-binding universal stress UspA family protein